jgi:leucyl aminopeptidase
LEAPYRLRTDYPASVTEFDGVILFIPSGRSGENFSKKIPEIGPGWADALLGFSEQTGYRPKPREVVSFDASPRQRLVLAALPKTPRAIDLLALARKALQPLHSWKAKRILVDLRPLGVHSEKMADALVSATVVLTLDEPKYRGKLKKETAKNKRIASELTLVVDPERQTEIQGIAKRAKALAQGTNLVRELGARATNDLTPSRYVALATRMAKEWKLAVEFYSLKRLEQMGAGAFLAVAQGSEDKGGGILKLSYRPGVGHWKKSRTSQRKLAIVGKGITFDTGGNNIKTGGHMYGMHIDMTGSAIALALVKAAVELQWPWTVSAYLAITDNILSPHAYKPNDVVTSLKGTTIEIVDTDAEGRMVLSDTLTLASQDSPDLILDFATLTGACLRALGTQYSGAYTNQRRLYSRILKAGLLSGERVWPFPNDSDYGKILKSDVADIKQCRSSAGGPDHIEAGVFLSRFVPRRIPWIHVDLSAATSDSGLGHVGGKLTGFGVRFGAQIAEMLLGDAVS